MTDTTTARQTLDAPTVIALALLGAGTAVGIGVLAHNSNAREATSRVWQHPEFRNLRIRAAAWGVGELAELLRRHGTASLSLVS